MRTAWRMLLVVASSVERFGKSGTARDEGSLREPRYSNLTVEAPGDELHAL